MRLGEDAYGIPVSREIEERSGREVALGSVYAALERLAEKGFVTSKLGDSTPERGGRAKRYFHVTGKGLREIEETHRTLKKLWPRRVARLCDSECEKASRSRRLPPISFVRLPTL